MIKNKNGQEYKISKPNPLMKYQDLWNLYTIHNFFWNEKVEKNIKEIIEKEIIEIEKEIIEKKIIENTSSSKMEDDNKKKEIECFYLKAEMIIKKDNFYGDEKKEIKYTQKEIINIKIKEYNDLLLSFNCKKQLNKDSIIFPKNKEKRWWRISKIEKDNENQYTYTCLPSDFTPSFD